MATSEFAGPVDYLVFTFDPKADLTAGLAAMLDRVREGIIEILDLELVARDSDGAPVSLTFGDLDSLPAAQAAEFDGARSDILDDEDLRGIVSQLEEGQIALAVVYEDRSLAVAADAWARSGGAELFAGGVDINDLEATLEEGSQS